MEKFTGIIVYIFVFIFSSFVQLKEPYNPVHNGSYSGFVVKESPDPLITYRWK